MPKYELMYIVGSEIADDAVPQVVGEVKTAIESGGGHIEKHDEWGRRKLAYPIGSTKNGFYAVVNFDAPGEKVNDIEQKIRTNLAIIRHLVVNMDEALERMEKDRIVQSQMKPRRIPAEETKPSEKKAEVRRSSSRSEGGKIEIDLDAEIEKAIGSEEVK